jgi:hypothetical protein
MQMPAGADLGTGISHTAGSSAAAWLGERLGARRPNLLLGRISAAGGPVVARPVTITVPPG